MKRIAVLTSGGDSPGMNPAIRSITRTGLNMGLEIFGIRNGYQGLLDEEIVPLDFHAVSGRIRDAGTFLQTSRCLEFTKEEGQKKALRMLEKYRIDGLIVIGGDGSLNGARALHRYGLPVIGLPGTIDNDLFGTDMGIGVDTALNTIISLVDMIRATAASHRRCFVVEVMGRGSGYLALMTTISTGSQVAVIPEYRMNLEKIIEVLDRRFTNNHNASVIIVAEGVCQGAEFMQRLIELGKVRQEIRLTVLGHVQRGGTPTHYDRLLASRMGEMAVLALISGERGCMVATVNGKMQLRDLDDILERRKALPADAIRLARNIGIEIGDVVER
ncbi:MAG: 6-phosphofructokinase [Methylacidiphilales bacterium]|nr:6-phosphofructokinase [Candidatus Methylacidiphilales bacterium]